VTIISTHVQGVPHGCTANAVASLSLDPPLMLACIDVKANTHPVLMNTGAFVINILRDDQENRRVAKVFAGKGDAKFSGLGYRRGVTGSPILTTCLAWLECALLRSYDGGDHTIFIGEVVDGGAVPGRPLLFYEGGYRSILEHADAAWPAP
jgi:flavin reductase (DIM6/NTAB) family NADH-FMN oxidoreductase RutF